MIARWARISGGAGSDWYGWLTLHLKGFVLQGAGRQAPFNGGATGADSHRHCRGLLLQGEV